MSMLSPEDKKFMRRCFSLARRGRGKVSPNPLVGAVIVKDGRILGEGWHRAYGEAHAEVNAFSDAKEDVAGATLYCNLEPCCHSGKKTPPCTPLIISKKIKKVVVSTIDPNPQVSGKGLQQMADAGIEVVTGVLKDEGRRLNKFFFTSIREKRPYVTLKIAQSLDGFISRKAGQQTWITGPAAQRFVHRLRFTHDAVLVGAKTVRADNPQLNVRLVKGRSPLRIVLDAGGIAPLEARIFNDRRVEKTIYITTAQNTEPQLSALRDRGVRVLVLPQDEHGRISPGYLIQELHNLTIGSLLVEGGMEVFSGFMRSGMFDELILLEGPVLFGKGLKAVDETLAMDLVLDRVMKLDRDAALFLRKRT